MSVNEQTPSSLISKTVNTVMTDSRYAAHANALINQSYDNSPFDLTVADIPWNLSHLLSKPILVSEFNWLTSTAIGNTLAVFNLPVAMNFSPNMLTNIFNIATFLRCGVRIELRINSNKFQAGNLLVQWKPMLPLSAPHYTVFDNIHYATCLPHVTASAGKSNTAILDIPFADIYSCYSIFRDGEPNLGEIAVIVLNSLVVGAQGSQQATCSVFCSLLNPEVRHLLPTSAGFATPSFSDTPGVVAQGLEKSNSKKPDSASNQGGVSKLLGAGKSAALAAADYETGNIPGVITNGISAISGGIDAATSLFAGNFDKPNVNQFPQPFIRNTILNPSLGVGDDTASELNLYPHTLHAPPHYFAGASADAMTFKSLVTKPSMIFTYSWSTSDNANANIFSYQVCPSSFGTNLSGSVIQPSWLQAVASHFYRWRGTIEIELRVVANEFYTGRLLFGYTAAPSILYDSVNTIPNNTELLQLNSAVFDLHETHVLKYTIPFNSDTPWKNTYPLADQLAPTQDAYSTVRGFGHSAGMIYLNVLNPLVAPVDTAASIDINLWVRGGDDMEFMLPIKTIDRFAYTPINTPTLFISDDDSMDVEAQALDETESEDLDNIDPITQQESGDSGAALQISDNPTPVQVMPDIGQSYVHIKDLLRRTQFLTTNTGIFPTTNPQLSTMSIDIPVSPVVAHMYFNSTTLANAPVTHLSYFSSMYAAWSGKLRYVFVIDSQYPCVLSVEHFPNQFYLNATAGAEVTVNSVSPGDGLAWQLMNTQSQQAIEVIVPWAQRNPLCYTDYNGLRRSGLPLIISSFGQDMQLGKLMNGSIRVDVTSQVAQRVKLDVYIAAGDDFCLYYPTAPPPIAAVQVTLPSSGFRARLSKNGNILKPNDSAIEKLIAKTRTLRV